MTNHPIRSVRLAQKSRSLVEIPAKDFEWANRANTIKPVRVFLSRSYLVQIFDEEHCEARLTVSSTKDVAGDWADGIPWDELQNIKRAVGYGDKMAVETYPRDFDVVNVANMRHLFVLDMPTDWCWKSGKYEHDIME